MLLIDSVLSMAQRGSKRMGKSAVVTLILIYGAIAGFVTAIIKSICFRNEFAHVSVTMQNGEIKLNKRQEPIIKMSGWHCQVPIRDHQRVVTCQRMTSHLAVQNIMAGDGKNEISLTVDWHVLSRRDGDKYRLHPARTLVVNDINQKVEEVCRDAVRAVMAKSETSASQWESKDLFKAMKPRVKKRLNKVGVKFDDVMLPNASLSEAQTLGKEIKEALGVKSSEISQEHHDEADFATPSLASVPS